jgi:hypothetical protein
MVTDPMIVAVGATHAASSTWGVFPSIEICILPTLAVR